MLMTVFFLDFNSGGYVFQNNYYLLLYMICKNGRKLIKRINKMETVAELTNLAQVNILLFRSHLFSIKHQKSFVFI